MLFLFLGLAVVILLVTWIILPDGFGFRKPVIQQLVSNPPAYEEAIKSRAAKEARERERIIDYLNSSIKHRIEDGIFEYLLSGKEIELAPIFVERGFKLIEKPKFVDRLVNSDKIEAIERYNHSITFSVGKHRGKGKPKKYKKVPSPIYETIQDGTTKWLSWDKS